MTQRLTREERNAQTKARNLNRKIERATRINEQLERWRKLTPMQKLAELDMRPGACKKERVRVKRLMTND